MPGREKGHGLVQEIGAGDGNDAFIYTAIKYISESEMPGELGRCVVDSTRSAPSAVPVEICPRSVVVTPS